MGPSISSTSERPLSPTDIKLSLCRSWTPSTSPASSIWQLQLGVYAKCGNFDYSLQFATPCCSRLRTSSRMLSTSAAACTRAIVTSSTSQWFSIRVYQLWVHGTAPGFISSISRIRICCTATSSTACVLRAIISRVFLPRVFLTRPPLPF